MSEELIILEIVEDEIVLEVEHVNNGPVTGAQVEDQIVDGVTTKAPSQNSVYDALSGKYPERTAGGSLVDGSSIPVDLVAVTRERWPTWLNTSQSAIAMPLSNFGDNKAWMLVVYKAIAGQCVITFSGTNLVFVELTAATKAAPAASLQVTIPSSEGVKTISKFLITQIGVDDPDKAGSRIVTVERV